MMQLKDLQQTAAKVANNLIEQESETGRLYQTMLKGMETGLISAAMHHTEGNKTAAAQMLGINRATLQTKIQRYELEF